MGKQGPCCHCGISTTPLWRNGPPEKPVLCNACGSRWKTKGTLLNYMPMHSGGFGANTEASPDLKWPRGRKGSHKHGEQRSHKRKLCDVEQEAGQWRPDQSSAKVQEDETVSRSCSWSGICNSEGSVGRGSSSTKDLSVVRPPWDASIPSKKRSPTLRLRTPADKLTRSLTSLIVDPVSIGHHVPTFNEAMLVAYNKPSLGALEIGLGSVFVRQPLSISPESKPEKTSFVVGSKVNELSNGLGQSESARGNLVPQFSNGSDKGSALRGKDKAKQVQRKSEAGCLHNEKILIPNKALLENFPYNKRDVLQSSQSPLVFLEMKDIVNFDTFTGLLTEQEQGQLMQYVSSADVARVPESLKCMFNSTQFEGALANFQHLLSEGMFDSLEQSLSPQVLQHYQQLATITDLTGSGWMEGCAQLHNRKKRKGSVDFTKVMQSKDLDKLKGPSFLRAPSSACSVSYGTKQLQSRPYDKAEDIKALKTNSFMGTTSSSLSAGLHSTNPVKHGFTTYTKTENSSNEAVDKEAVAKSEGTHFLSNEPFLSVDEREPTFGEHYLDMGGMDSGEGDALLFDVPNPMSFQQAELLQQPSWAKTKASKEEETDPSQLESGGLIMSNTWHTDTSPAEWGLLWNSSCVGHGQVLPNGTVLNPGTSGYNIRDRDMHFWAAQGGIMLLRAPLEHCISIHGEPGSKESVVIGPDFHPVCSQLEHSMDFPSPPRLHGGIEFQILSPRPCGECWSLFDTPRRPVGGVREYRLRF